MRGTQRSVSLPRQLLERRSPHPAAGPSEAAATNANPMDENPRQDKKKKEKKAKAKASKARGSGGASPPFEVVKPAPPQRSVSLSASGPRSALERHMCSSPPRAHGTALDVALHPSIASSM